MDDITIPFIWVAITLPILLIVERWIHRHLRGVALIITGQHDMAIYIYAIVLFPGVFLHEFSHWLMAGLLGVKTGRFSVFPRQKADGTLQLGYVEYYRDITLGPIRESIIGAAPLIFGSTVVVLIGRFVFNMPELLELLRIASVDYLGTAFRQIVQTNDFFLWLYLLFAVSNAMMPSPSDRRAWPLLLVVVVTFIGALYLLDIGDVVMTSLAQPVSTLFGYLGVAFTVTIVVDLFFAVVIAILEAVLSRITNRRIHYY